MIPVKYHEAAEQELVEEVGYLELRARGLGRRLLAEVQRVEAILAEFPEAGAVIRRGIRRHPLRTFSYSIIYAIEEDSLLILAFAHHRRRPGYWSRRPVG